MGLGLSRGPRGRPPPSGTTGWWEQPEKPPGLGNPGDEGPGLEGCQGSPLGRGWLKVSSKKRSSCQPLQSRTGSPGVPSEKRISHL